MKSIKDYNARTFKRPTTNHKDYVGVEIECYIPKDKFKTTGFLCRDCQDECQCDLLECSCFCDCDKSYIDSVSESIEKLKIEGIQVTTDGSIGCPSGCIGLEIKVLTRKSSKSNLKKLCGWLKKNKAMVNDSCGLHVHLDCRHSEPETVKNNLFSKLELLKKIMPVSRLKNQYCRDGVSSEAGDKYRMINLTSFNKYRTIEVRLHYGTIDYKKISNYIDLLTYIKNDKSPDEKIKEYVLNELHWYNPEEHEKFVKYVDKNKKKKHINKNRKRAA